MVHDAWWMVRGAWCTVHGAWCMVHGAWCMVHDNGHIPPTSSSTTSSTMSVAASVDDTSAITFGDWPPPGPEPSPGPPPHPPPPPLDPPDKPPPPTLASTTAPRDHPTRSRPAPSHLTHAAAAATPAPGHDGGPAGDSASSYRGGSLRPWCGCRHGGGAEPTTRSAPRRATQRLEADAPRREHAAAVAPAAAAGAGAEADTCDVIRRMADARARAVTNAGAAAQPLRSATQGRNVRHAAASTRASAARASRLSFTTLHRATACMRAIEVRCVCDAGSTRGKRRTPLGKTAPIVSQGERARTHRPRGGCGGGGEEKRKKKSHAQSRQGGRGHWRGRGEQDYAAL
eukprot:365335-Chlamydomonas_euryale.AAC.5